MVPILKMRRFFCLLRLSLPPEMGEMAQTLILEIEWSAVLKCRPTDCQHHSSLRNEGVQQIWVAGTFSAGTFSCSRARCYTCSFLKSATSISRPKSNFVIRHNFTCTSRHFLYCQPFYFLYKSLCHLTHFWW